MKPLVLTLIACATIANAADKDPLRALHAECAKAGDVWTCLQLEAWAKANDQKLRPLLGDSQVHGDILFAFPQPISNHWESSNYIGLTTWDRFYLLAPDGRPLVKSIPLPPSTNASTLSYNGEYLATIQRVMINQAESELTISSRHAGDGDELVSGNLRIPGGAWWTGLTVANDGSAVLIGMRTPTKDGPNQWHDEYSLIMYAGGKRKHFEHMNNPGAVGPNGAWFVAEQQRPQNHWVLVIGDKEIPIRTATAGPGVAIVVADKPLWVAADGRTEDFPLPFGLGDQPQLSTVGTWVVFGSGNNGKGQETTDLLGNVVKPSGPQPYTTAFYRWEDLVANRQIEPVEKIENTICPVQTETASLFVWQDKQIDTVDLIGHDIVRKPFATMPAAVQWIDGRFHRTRVHCSDGTWVILDDRGRDLWRGVSSNVEIIERRHLFSIKGDKETSTYELIDLDTDEAKRKAVKLELQPGPWWVEMDCWNLQTLAVQQNVWARIDRESGKVLSMNPLMQAKPGVNGLWDQPGKFRRQHTRLVAKSRYDDQPLTNYWAPIDSWRLNKTLVVLNEWSSVSISGKKPGEYIDLGQSSGAKQLALGNDQPLVLVDENRDICGSIVPGPTLIGRRADDKKGKDLPSGPWRVNNMQFTPPRNKTFDWDSAKVGFAPRRLRSPESGSLLVITGSVVIELDPQAGPIFGKAP